MSTEWGRSLEIKATYLLAEYIQIVNEFFPGATSIDEFVESFNQIFTQYQNIVTRKMDPRFIRERAASCSSFAALFGTWLAREFPQYVPYYLIEIRSFPDKKMQEQQEAKSKSHVTVAVPTTNVVHPRQAAQLIVNTKDAEQHGLRYVDWPPKGKLNPNPPAPGTYPLQVVANLKSLVKNRVKILGLPPYYSTNRGILRGK